MVLLRAAYAPSDRLDARIAVRTGAADDFGVKSLPFSAYRPQIGISSIKANLRIHA
jgi:hypothetical protein